MTSLLESPMGLPLCIVVFAFVMLMVIVVLGICRVPGFRNLTIQRDYEPPAPPEPSPSPRRTTFHTKPLPTVTTHAERVDK